MKKKNKTHILSRYVLIVAVTLLVAGLIVYKLSVTTLVQKDAWNAKASEVLMKTKIVAPERGTIYASDGSVLASNITKYDARIDWSAANGDSLLRYVDGLCDSLAVMFPKKDSKKWKEYLDLDSNLSVKGKRNRGFLLVPDLDKAQCERMKKFPYFLLRYRKKYSTSTGLVFDPKTVRVNPFGKMARRCIGKVEGSYQERTLVYHGKSGLELSLDSLLYGTNGLARKVQLTNRYVNWSEKPAVPGYDVHTTIDVNIQDILECELERMCIETEAAWGTAVIMEVATGDIKAMSNMGMGSKPRAGVYFEDLNRSIWGFELGSVMKTITMLLGLEGHFVRPYESIPTGSIITYFKTRIRDHGSASSLTPAEILERSSNIGISKIMLRGFEHNPAGYRKALDKIGFTEKMNFGLDAAEQPPYIRKLGNKPEDRIDLTRMSFGYSMLVSPMSILAVYNAIANNGKYVRPRLITELSHKGITDTVFPVSYIREQICSPENARYLREMLHQVVWGAHGTGRRLKNDKVEIAGKTGTCEIPDVGGYNRSKKRMTFCGFFPYNNPKYTCIVVMERCNVGAAASSGTVLKNVALKLYARGMLGNSSDYRAGKSNAPRKGVLFATPDNKGNSSMKSEMCLSNVATFASPKPQPQGCIPSVIGYGLADAISTLENTGLNVRVIGEGYVVGQTPRAGSKITKEGELITIKLKI